MAHHAEGARETTSTPAPADPGAAGRGVPTGATVSLPLEPLAGSVPLARHRTAAAVAAWHLGPLADTAELVASELVTNAVLHARTTFELRLRRLTKGLLIEVHDDSPLIPLERSAPGRGEAALLSGDSVDELVNLGATGRGLRLVERCAARWGVRHEGAGKAVWALLGDGESPSDPAPDGPTRDAATDAASLCRVRLAAVPLRLALASDLNLDTVVRELRLVELSQAPGRPVAPPPGLGEALGALLARLAAERRANALAIEEALVHGHRLLDADLFVPAQAADDLHRLHDLLEEVAQLSRTGALLSMAPSDEVVAFRRWYAEEVERQLAGAPARPCPFTLRPPSEAPELEVDLGAQAVRVVEAFADGLAEAEPATVVRALLREVTGTLGATQASVWVLPEGADRAELLDELGMAERLARTRRSFSLFDDLPGAEAIRTRRPVTVRTRLERDLRYPALDPTGELPNPTIVCLPLDTGERVLGCLSVSFGYSRDFTTTDYRLLAELVAVAGRALPSSWSITG